MATKIVAEVLLNIISVVVNSPQCTTCKHTNLTPEYKLCKPCRDREKTWKKNRKRKREKISVPEGKRRCTNCLHIEDLKEFESDIPRRKKLTTLCRKCREIKKKTENNPETKRGKCKKWWQDWKKANSVCCHCHRDDWRVIEGDHCRGAKKIHRLCHYSWWACNGGVEAMKKEALKCQPLCSCCHRIKSQSESGKLKNVTILKRRAIINAEKHKRAECLVCKRKVVQGHECAFDFDHRDEEKKVISISNLVYKSSAFFNKHFPIEQAKCDLLCCNCHLIKTSHS